MAAQEDVDYAEAGRKLLVNLSTGGDVPKVQRYSPYNAIWRHPENKATLFVGNASTAADMETLNSIRVKRIVFCQERDGRCHFESVSDFRYLKFAIGSWRRSLGNEPTTEAVWAYFKVLFDFVDRELGAGNNVLIHCLAGAHRAGTAGTACLMHLCQLDSTAAVPLAKSLRPAIDPIGSFPELLRLLDEAFQVHDRKEEKALP
mmetsp:Transcript_15428/g.31714  ORF Transcript_15428/g.31714 Transcript_15428/m.31714 type:complete len:203 (-) Transcript_15428:276-884(-)